MSSIDHKTGGNLPSLPGSRDPAAETQAAAEAAAPFPADTAADAKARQLIATQGSSAMLAMMGMTPTGLSRVLKGEPSNKFSTAATITSSPPPLPLDRSPVTPETRAHYAALSQDMATAFSQASPTRASGRTAAVLGQAAEAPAASDFVTQLPGISEAEAQTPAGQAKIENIVAKGFSAAAGNLNAMGAGSMMEAFMILRVENKSSGKEAQSTLQDLATDARNSDLKKQMLENQAASAATKKAAEKQKKMGFLAPLIEAIVAIISAIISVVSMGTCTGLAIVLAASILGFLVGGAIGGAKKGNGFDITSAITGGGIGAGVAKIAGMVISKLLTVALEKVGEKVAAEAVTKVGVKLVSNMSTKATVTEGIALGAVGAAGEVAKGAMNYDYAQILLDAKQHQANAKMAQVMAEMMQNQWTALQGTLSGMAENHNTAVNQVMAMMKSQFAASQKTVSQISR